MGKTRVKERKDRRYAIPKNAKFGQNERENEKTKENKNPKIFLKNKAEKMTGMGFWFEEIHQKLTEKKFENIPNQGGITVYNIPKIKGKNVKKSKNEGKNNKKSKK